MKDLKDIIKINESHYETDENGLMVLDNHVFGAMMLDKTTGQIQIYKAKKLQSLIDDWEDMLDGFTIKDLKKMKSGGTQEFGGGSFVLFKF